MSSTRADGNNGAFDIESPEPGWRLALIASDGSDPSIAEKWEHVSVHAFRGDLGRPSKLRTPTWREMSYVKRLCWDAEDVVMQLHPAESQYVNAHPHVLHLWRPIGREIPTPPSIFVGPKTDEEWRAALAAYGR
jgi:hypothetical protein